MTDKEFGILTVDIESFLLSEEYRIRRLATVDAIEAEIRANFTANAAELLSLATANEWQMDKDDARISIASCFGEISISCAQSRGFFTVGLEGEDFFISDIAAAEDLVLRLIAPARVLPKFE